MNVRTLLSLAWLGAVAAAADDAACAADAARPIVLRYFDVRGRGEAIRMALADQGLEFEDAAFSSAEWGKDKPDGLKAEWLAAGKLPFGQVPLLEIDGLQLVQSHTILRYLGRRQGWYEGKYDTLARVDLVADGTEDVRKQLSAIKYSDDSDAEKARRTALYFSAPEAGARWLGYLDALVGQSATPFAAGTREPTHADYLLLDLIDYHESASADGAAALLGDMPHLVKWRAAMLARPLLKAYLAGAGRRAA